MSQYQIPNNWDDNPGKGSGTGLLLVVILFILFVASVIYDKAQSAELYIWSPELWPAIAKVESGCGKALVGDDGKSRGMFQVQLDTARRLGYRGTKKMLQSNHAVNLEYAQKLLFSLWMKYDLDIYKSLFAYNARYRAVKRMEAHRSSFKRSKYVKSILNVIKENKYCKNMEGFYAQEPSGSRGTNKTVQTNPSNGVSPPRI